MLTREFLVPHAEPIASRSVGMIVYDRPKKMEIESENRPSPIAHRLDGKTSADERAKILGMAWKNASQNGREIYLVATDGLYGPGKGHRNEENLYPNSKADEVASLVLVLKRLIKQEWRQRKTPRLFQ